MTERDLDLLLLTGAGASCSFGMDGQRLPLMSDWSIHVTKTLGSHSWSLIKASGLAENLDGWQFEDQLGSFLRAVSAFEQIEPLLEASLDFPSVPSSVKGQGELARWHYAATAQWKQAVGLIHKSLYDLFGDPRVDVPAAAHAYEDLLQHLGIGLNSRWVYATTNYDTVAERAIERMGGRPDWGELPSLDANNERRLDVSNLIEAVGRSVPVLHLHGRIGWFRRSASDGGYTYAVPVKTWTDGIGVPIVMLPDPKKIYDEHDVVLNLWQQFEIALPRAQRVLVLGHSLNDPAILDALRRVEPERIAVGLLARTESGTDLDPSAEPLAALLRRELPGVTEFPLIFGRPFSEQVASAIARWTEKVNNSERH